jgi:hypothetical protein
MSIREVGTNELQPLQEPSTQPVIGESRTEAPKVDVVVLIASLKDIDRKRALYGSALVRNISDATKFDKHALVLNTAVSLSENAAHNRAHLEVALYQRLLPKLDLARSASKVALHNSLLSK